MVNCPGVPVAPPERTVPPDAVLAPVDVSIMVPAVARAPVANDPKLRAVVADIEIGISAVALAVPFTLAANAPLEKVAVAISAARRERRGKVFIWFTFKFKKLTSFVA